jgi:group I intron endonuclease
MPWTIYCHTHIDSKRRYIGLTSRTWQRRWSDHINAAKSSKGGRWHFPNAIRKFGSQAFSHEVLEICETLEEANLAEAKWIDHFNSRDPQLGFNLAKGGEHTPHPIRKNPWDRPEFRERMLEINKKVWGDPNIRGKISISLKETLTDPQILASMSERAKKQWNDPDSRAKGIEATKKKSKDPNFRKKLSDKWLDPVFRDRCSAGPIAARASQASKTHCKHGHEYTLENTRRDREGGRECRICHNLSKVKNKTHCPNGHEYISENTYFNKRGARLCRICGSRPHRPQGYNLQKVNRLGDGRFGKCL